MFSADKNQKDAQQWSANNNFPWPQILPKNTKAEYSFMKYRSRSVPQYLLVDRNGVKLAEGKDESLAKIKSLKMNGSSGEEVKVMTEADKAAAAQAELEKAMKLRDEALKAKGN